MIGNMSTPPANWDARKGGIVRKRRQVLGMDQRDLAELVGVHVNSVQRWEAGKQYPGRRLGKLEAVLGITVDDGSEHEEPEMPTQAELDDLREHIREVLGDEAENFIRLMDEALAATPPHGPGTGAAPGRAASESARWSGREQRKRPS